jgi:hypothetical protein
MKYTLITVTNQHVMVQYYAIRGQMQVIAGTECYMSFLYSGDCVMYFRRPISDRVMIMLLMQIREITSYVQHDSYNDIVRIIEA